MIWKKLQEIVTGKSAEEHIDPLQVKLSDLGPGSILTYMENDFEVLERYEYDWGDEEFSTELQVKNASGEVLYLSIEEDDEVATYLFKEISLAQLDFSPITHFKHADTPPVAVQIGTKSFRLIEESAGYFRRVSSNSKTDWKEMMVWDYQSTTGDDYFSLEQWGEGAFEASLGQKVNARLFKNLIPAKF